MKDGNLIPLMLRRIKRARGYGDQRLVDLAWRARLDGGVIKRRAFDVLRFVYGFIMVGMFVGCILLAIVAFGDWR